MGAVEMLPGEFLPGDYNYDLRVNSADYSVWQAAMGMNVSVPGDGADGNGDGKVDQLDFDVWASNFGARFDDLPELGLGGAGLAAVERAPAPAEQRFSPIRHDVALSRRMAAPRLRSPMATGRALSDA